MRAMSNKGFGNGKATMDNGNGMFLTMLEYKLSERGKIFVKVSKWYPSSQLCHRCGTIHLEMKDTHNRQCVAAAVLLWIVIIMQLSILKEKD